MVKKNLTIGEITSDIYHRRMLKQNRGCVSLFFLYDNEGEKDLDKHIAAMERSFRYGEEQPLKKRLEDENMQIIFVPMPAQKKRNPIR